MESQKSAAPRHSLTETQNHSHWVSVKSRPHRDESLERGSTGVFRKGHQGGNQAIEVGLTRGRSSENCENALLDQMVWFFDGKLCLKDDLSWPSVMSNENDTQRT